MTYEMDQHLHRLQQLQHQQLQRQKQLKLSLRVLSSDDQKKLSQDSGKRNAVHLSNLLHPELGGDSNTRNTLFNNTNSIATPQSVHPQLQQLQQQLLQTHIQQAQQLPLQQQLPLSPFNVEQNMSFARGELTSGRSFLSKGFSEASNAVPGDQGQAQPIEKSASNVTDEDERFLRLAREALVATALTGRVIVDPTIQDLLQRLQYASSPHGNPIKHSSDIRANEYGQLMIQGFYQSFPNLSNDVFTGSPSASPNSHFQLLLQDRQFYEKDSHQNLEDNNTSSNHPSNMHNDGWNFLLDGSELVDRNSSIHSQSQQPNQSLERRVHQLKTQRHPYDDDGGIEQYTGDEEDADEDSEGSASIGGSGGPSRTFICQDCQMSFKRSSDLKRHEKQHLTIPPNICELCGKGFARKDALKRHLGTLTCRRNADKKAYVENLKYVQK